MTRFAHDPLALPPRPRHYIANGVIRPLRWEVPPELEPEETEREILTFVMARPPDMPLPRLRSFVISVVLWALLLWLGFHYA